MFKGGFKPGWALTATFLVCLVILSSLGLWQASKISAKTKLLEQITAGLSATALPLPIHVDDPVSLSYRKVTFVGSVADKEIIQVFGTNRKGKPGYYLYQPVKSQYGMAVIVNWGWIPLSAKTVPALPVGEVRVSGVLMLSAIGNSFTPENKPETKEWYVANVHELAAAFGLRTKEYYHFRIFSDQTESPSGLPLGGQVRIDIPNNHFEYTLTWFGLAAAMTVVYVAFGIKRAREANSGLHKT